MGNRCRRSRTKDVAFAGNIPQSARHDYAGRHLTLEHPAPAGFFHAHSTLCYAFCDISKAIFRILHIMILANSGCRDIKNHRKVIVPSQPQTSEGGDGNLELWEMPSDVAARLLHGYMGLSVENRRIFLETLREISSGNLSPTAFQVSALQGKPRSDQASKIAEEVCALRRRQNRESHHLPAQNQS